MDRPFRMDIARLTRLQSLVAEGPSPPVVSKANGQQVQSANRHGPELDAFFANSAADAVAVASSRVAWGPEMRNGWTMVTSTAKGLESVEWRRTSAGLLPDEVRGSRIGRHPASWAKENRESRMRLWRRYKPAEAQDKEWSPNVSIGDPQAAHIGDGSWDKGTPVLWRKSACHSGAVKRVDAES